MANTAGGPHAATILVAEDDKQVRESLIRVLEFEGYRVVAVNDGAQALEAYDESSPDLCLLDVMMPMVDGLDVCRRLRARGERVPILCLTARVEISDRVAGLDAGADDYLAKPFALDELLARLRALLRRVEPPEATAPIQIDDLVLDPMRRQARRGDREIDLTKTEFELLELLMLNEGIVLERSTIYERIWGYDFGTSSKSLDVYIGYLRRKTEAEGEHRLVHTVRGVGYVVRSGS